MEHKKIKNAIKDAVKESHLGELNDKDVDVSVNVKQKRPKIPENIMVFQVTAYMCATELKPASNKILMLFYSLSAYENYISMDVSTMCEVLGMSKPTVVNGLKELVDNNVIVKLAHPTDNRRHDYFLNPYTAWKGNSYARKEMINRIKGSSAAAQLDMFSGRVSDDKDLKINRLGE